MSTKHIPPRLWWEREDLCYRKGRLFLGRRDLLEFAQSAGTPVYLYNSARIKENLTRLAQSLGKKEIKFKIFYALKANRFLPLVTYLKMLGRCGVDACSPGELRLARQAGFNQEDITYTGTSISNEDLDCLQRNPHVWINCDAISTIKRLGERCPGRPIGVLILQVNTVEGKGGTKFIGVNGGFNIQNLPAYYNTPITVAPLSKNATVPQEQVTIAGNINEAIDLLAENILLPPVQEGDYLGFLNVGGYGSAASSNHCMRSTFSEYLMFD